MFVDLCALVELLCASRTGFASNTDFVIRLERPLVVASTEMYRKL